MNHAAENDSLRLLVLEDSENDAELVTAQLQHAGFDVVYHRVDTCEGLKQALSQHTWDLIISDYSMPNFKGTDALKTAQELGIELPFIFVSGTIHEETAVEAMRSGAHDYVMKDNLRRLAPAVRRELAEAESRRRRKAAERDLHLRDARIRALHEINVAITSTLNLPKLLEILLGKIDLLLPILLRRSVCTISRNSFSSPRPAGTSTIKSGA